ncbi:MAG: CDP-alcohol phosphatidyltransferase family protein [Candidatus Thermoplasmatota archaeon]
MWLKKISIADILTLCNGICGVSAIMALFIYKKDITLATSLIIIAIIFDGADGAVARYLGTKHPYGRVLDSISDSISFCLAPALLLIIVYFSPSNTFTLNFLTIISAIAVLSMGIWRLIKFTKIGYKYVTFAGLPTPAMALLTVTLTHLYFHQPLIVFPIIIAASLLMISKIKYPKIRGRLAVVFGIFVLLFMFVIFTQNLYVLSSDLDFRSYLYKVGLLTSVALLLFYILGGPLIVSFPKKKKTMQGLVSRGLGRLRRRKS